jgi:hypothetical protein
MPGLLRDFLDVAAELTSSLVDPVLAHRRPEHEAFVVTAAA